jgi:hypothetical protein
VLRAAPEVVQARIHEGMTKMREARGSTGSCANSSPGTAISEGER